MPVDLPAGIKQDTASTVISSNVAATLRPGNERAERPVQPVMFLRRYQAIGERNLPAVALGEKVVASDRFAHDDRSSHSFKRVDVTYLAGGTGIGFDLLNAGVTTG